MDCSSVDINAKARCDSTSFYVCTASEGLKLLTNVYQSYKQMTMLVGKKRWR